jgi:hypothetical protein
VLRTARGGRHVGVELARRGAVGGETGQLLGGGRDVVATRLGREVDPPQRAAVVAVERPQEPLRAEPVEDAEQAAFQRPRRSARSRFAARQKFFPSP